MAFSQPKRLAFAAFSTARVHRFARIDQLTTMWKNLGGCLLVILAVGGFYVAITMSFTFFLLPIAFVLFFICMLLLSLALGPADRPRD